MSADLIVTNISTIYTPYKKPPVHGRDMMSIHEFHHAYLAIKDGMIIAIGSGDYQKYIGSNTIIHDADQKIMIPGLVDSHTHLVHGGSRESEYKRLIAGTPYLQILSEGGGILGTVEMTRKATFSDLFKKAKKSLDEMMLYGVTTIESKSGYGLNLDDEIKQLKVNKKLNQEHPIHIVSTYMGAHAIPKEFKDDKDLYIDQLLLDMEVIRTEGLAEAVDVFCENGVFSIKDTKRILNHAKEIGFKIKLHADEIHPLGGAGLGVELGATSVDHLMAISDEDIHKLADSNTIANLLPGTSFYLRKKYANARKMIDQGVAVAISGDYNPGSCPTENFQFIMQLASNQLQMMPEEVLNAVTINPAYHLGLHQEKGSLEVGKSADFVILDAPNLTYVLYHYGINHTKDVYIKGKPVVLNRRIVR
ncbi:MAG: imidazolonepropionase [Tenericutes bacterium]|nr:imidazolonepropionase [Mycoplasmatota bacterium]